MPPSSNALFNPLVEHAIELAAQWHEGTYRKGTWREDAFGLQNGSGQRAPVMTHLTAVATIVQRAGWDDVTVAAAYLHDALEDENQDDERLPRETLRAAIGEDVTRLVEYVSERKLDAHGKQRPWQARKDGYLTQLQDAPPEAVGISLADKLHNLWTMNQTLKAGTDIFTDAGPNRRPLSAGPERQLWFYRSVLDVSKAADDPRLPPMRTRLGRELDRFAAALDVE